MTRRQYLLRIALLAILCGFAIADEPEAAEKAKPGITRADLGVAYLRLDHAFTANPPADAKRVAEINQQFDKATVAFFGGQFANTLRTIDQLSGELLFPEHQNVARAGMALKAELDPPVDVVGSGSPVKLQVRSLYDPQLEEPATFDIRLVDADATAVFTAPLTFPVGTGAAVHEDFDLTAVFSKLSPGLYAVEAGIGRVSISLAQYAVVDRSLDAVRNENAARLDKVAAKTPALAAAIAACRDRNRLLTDTPSVEQSSQFLVRPPELIRSLIGELAALEQGRDPYLRRTGDYWRTFQVGDKTIPMRVYAPAKMVGPKSPLLIALHGAGADENMFFEGYGAGRLKQLADQYGLLVVTPSTYAFSKPETFDGLLTAIGYDYDNIDTNRIYVLGHSMGGGSTAQLAVKRADRIAAACCLAGGGRSRGDQAAPTLVIAARLDAVVPALGLESAAKKGIAEGLPIEFRMLEDYGHTLMVGKVLPDAVGWLTEHSRND